MNTDRQETGIPTDAASIAERANATAQADASLRLSGGTRSPEARVISDRYVRGEISLDEMVSLTLALHGAERML